MSFRKQSKWPSAAVLLTGLASVSVGAQAQVVFLDTFGTSQTRIESPFVPQMYLPAVGMDDSNQKFTHGDGYYKLGQVVANQPTGEGQNQTNIDNGYYAVGNPDIFVSGAYTPWNPDRSSYWFRDTAACGDFTGSAAGSAPGASGAVLAINAGMVRNEFYRRQFVLEPGATYRMRAAFYVANNPVVVRFEAQRADNGELLGSSDSLTFASTKVWEVKEWSFTIPDSCNRDLSYGVALRNLQATNNGNDFYVDDISLEKITSGNGSSITCPTEPAPTIRAEDNAWTVTPGSTTPGSVLEGDTSNGKTATTGNTTLTVIENKPGFTVNPDGSIAVPTGTEPGTYELRYQICVAPETTPWPTCDEAIATITVKPTPVVPTAPTVNAENDDFTGTPTEPGSSTPTILTNDDVDGDPVKPGTNGKIELGDNPPAGFTIDPDTGTIKVGSDVPDGDYSVPYKLCPLPTTAETKCDTATAKITVKTPETGGDDGGNVGGGDPVTPPGNTPGVTPGAGGAQPVPSLGTWALMLLSSLIAGLTMLRRRVMK